MSLYRTWRPKTFSDLVGQDAVVRTLTSALETGKLAHAYLFSGPRGSGKTSAAKILARCIDCVHGPTATPDNTCDNCVAILNGTALDVLEIDAASNRGIDEIRALRDAVKFAPSVMRMKVYIIDEAHMLTKEGANAFLKTLEEPPPHAVFILATTEPEKLPVTILSRCQRYAFRRIAIPVMIERMREIAEAERIAIDEHALAAIAYRADGGLRDALTMLEQAAAFGDGTITGATLDLAFGATGRQYAAHLIDAIVAKDPARTLALIEEASDAGTDMGVLTRTLTANFRNLLVARIDPQLLQRDLAPEDAERAAGMAASVPQAAIVRALRVLSDAQNLARSGGNPRLELETALLRFILASEDPTLEALSARLAVLESAGVPAAGLRPAPPAAEPPPAAAPAPAVAPGRGTASEPVPAASAEPVGAPAREPVPRTAAKPASPAPAPADTAAAPPVSPAPPVSAAPPAAAAATGPVSVQKVRAAWMNIRGKVESERAPLRGPLSGAMVDAVDGNTVVLRMRNGLDADVVKSHVTLVEAAIADVLGTPMRVSLKSGASAPALILHDEETPELPGEDPDVLFSYLNERIQ